jgi:hypothetical protein
MSKVGKIICGRVPRATLLWVAFVAAAPRLGEAAESIDYKSLYRRTSAAVVALMATDGSVGQRGTGSLIDAKGLVLTNTHVVTRRTKGDKGKGTDWPHLFVVLKPVRISGKASLDLKRRYRARVVARHPAWDLALVQIIDPPAGLPALPLSSLEGVGVGEPTVAIGHPGGGALWSLTTGRISGAFSDYRGVRGWDVFQTETALNPGNSGGPLLDGSGGDHWHQHFHHSHGPRTSAAGRPQLCCQVDDGSALDCSDGGEAAAGLEAARSAGADEGGVVGSAGTQRAATDGGEGGANPTSEARDATVGAPTSFRKETNLA